MLFLNIEKYGASFLSEELHGSEFLNQCVWNPR